MKLTLARDGQTPRAAAQPLIASADLGSTFGVGRDGKRIVATRGRSFGNIWITTMPRSSSTDPEPPVAVTRGTSSIAALEFSPDGRRLAFTAGSAERSELFSLDLDTGRETRLAVMSGFSTGPVWSPDGARIAFTSGIPFNSTVHVFAANGGTPRSYPTKVSGSGDLAWAPSREILYQLPGNRNYAVLDPDTRAERRLVAADSIGWLFEPVYSPDGRQVAVAYNRREGDGRPRQGLWVLAVGGAGERKLANGRFYPLRWSADAKWIYAIQPQSPPVLVRVSTQDGRVEQVATLPFEDLIAFSLAPDERRLACVVPDSKYDAWLIDRFDPDLR
jgi:Tol biopolymer transport system component